MGRSAVPFRSPGSRLSPVLLSRRLFYGWWIVGAGVVINALVGALFMQAYGVYVAVFKEDPAEGGFGWSSGMLAGGHSVVQGTNGAIGPVQGWLTDRFGPRAIIRIGLALFGGGLMLFSRIDAPAHLFLALVVVAAGISLGGFLSLMVAVVNWFERYRATAISFLTGGFAVGGMLVLLTALAIETFGWRATAFASGLLVLGVGLPVSQLVRHRPEDHGYEVDGGPPPAVPGDAPGAVPAVSTVEDGFTVGEALRTRQFWLISLGHGSALLVISAVMVHLITHLRESLDYSLTGATLVTTVITAAQVAGTFAGGFFGDRVSKRGIAIGAMLAQGGGLILLATSGAVWIVVLFALAHGLAWGVRGPVMLALRADYFGRRDFGKIMGLSQMVMTTGMMSGPLFAGFMRDALGDFQLAFIVLGLLAAAGSLFFVFAPRPRRPLAGP